MRTTTPITRGVVAVAAVAAMTIVMVTAVGAQPSEAAPDATVVDHGRHNRPTPAHPVCPERSVDKEDPSGDAAGLDIVWYAAGFDQCGPLRFLLQLEPDWTLEDLAKFVIRLDTDEDRITGCHGNDYRYEGTHSTGRIHRTPTCDRAGWATVEVDPPELWYACGIPVCVGPFLRATVPVWAIGGSHRVRWSLSLSAAGGGVDRAPDRGSRPAWMVEPPSPPRYIRAVHDDGTVELRWGRSDPGGGGPIEDYEIWVDAPRSRWQRIDDGVNAVRKATITGLTDSERYRFAVAAVTGDGAGRSSWVQTPVPVPTKPRQLTALGGDGQVDLTWKRPASRGHNDYRIRYRPVGVGTWSVFDDGRSSTPRATVDGLVSGQPYEFTVAAVNAGGRGPWSDRATATPTG